MVTKTLRMDSIQTSNDGLDFDADNETWFINRGIVDFSQSSYAVFSNGHVNNELINYGQVSSAGEFFQGVLLTGGNTSITNHTGGSISAPFDATFLAGAGRASINNDGTLIGVTHGGIVIGSDVTSFTVNNHGYDFGGRTGVYDISLFGNGVINNYGTMRSDLYGIAINSAPNLTTTIYNGHTGFLSGLTAAIDMQSGILHLTNDGVILGDVINADNANDRIINHAKIVGTVDLGAGNSYFNGSGGFDPTIVVDGGHNRVAAGEGNVSIFIHGGNNTLAGEPNGPSVDKYYFEAPLDGQVEHLVNFKHGVDKIVLSEADFAGIGPVGHPLARADFRVGTHATTASQHIIYDHQTGALFYDPDGSGPIPEIQFATLSFHPTLTHADFLVEA